MTTETEDAAVYHDAVAGALASRRDRSARFTESLPAYDRYYDLAVKVGHEVAAEALPEEAAVVAEIEKPHFGTNEQVAAVSAALVRALERRMNAIATGSVMQSGSIVGRLRKDMMDLCAFRIRSLDGIDGDLWALVKCGEGFDRKQSDRMLNRVLAEWCAVYEIKLLVIQKAVGTIEMLPDAERYGVPAGVAPVFEKHAAAYPFDLISDLTEVREWGEKDAVFIDSIISHHAETGEWNPSAPTKGWYR